MKKTNTINKVKRSIFAVVCATLVAVTCLSVFNFGAPSNNGAGKLSLFVTASAESVNENYVEKTLTATVLPENAPDKSLDWSVEWYLNNQGENSGNVTDYVTVTPTSDGSNVASVKCYRAFPGSTIVVTCTTRVGNFSARCIVTYLGTPSTFNIVQEGGTKEYDEDWGVEIINLPIGQTYNFDLSLNNIFGVVTDDYARSWEVTNVGVGRLYLKVEQNINGVIQPVETWDYEADKAEFCCTARVEDGTLKINSIKSFEAMSFYRTSGRAGVQFTFIDYNGAIPYYSITVTEKNSGLSQTINVRPEAVITDVSLDKGNLVF